MGSTENRKQKPGEHPRERGPAPEAESRLPAVEREREPTEREIDKALADTFPASDPVALHFESDPLQDPEQARAPRETREREGPTE